MLNLEEDGRGTADAVPPRAFGERLVAVARRGTGVDPPSRNDLAQRRGFLVAAAITTTR